MVRRDHIAALDPANGKALEWNPGSNSYEGNKAMKVTANGLIAGGDATTQGGYNVGRVAFYDFRTVAAATATETTIEAPVTGRIIRTGSTFTITGKATANQGVKRVQVEVIANGRYLQKDLTTWGSATSIYATLGTPGTDGWTPYSLALTIPDVRAMTVTAKTYGNDGTNDATKATKKIETFSYDDQTPATGISAPTGVVPNTTFTVSGTASDDKGVTSIRLYMYDEQNRYLTADGDLASSYTTFSIDPDVVGATSATWSREFTVPHEGVWTVGATAVDTIGQPDIAEAKRNINVNSTAAAPAVTISAPVAVTPPTVAPAFTVTPGAPLTFRGTASDTDGLIKSVEISLRNTSTRENLAADGSWGTNAIAGRYRLSPANWLSSPTTNSYSWSYTTPFNLTPGSYTFSVRATDSTDLATASANQGVLSFTAQTAGDAFPDGLLSFTGTNQNVDTLRLDLAGTATDDKGVASVGLAVLDSDTGRYLQANGQLVAGFALVPATLASPGATSTAFSASIALPQAGNYGVTAYAMDTAGQQDQSTTGATARYLVYPGDANPALVETLVSPVSNQAYTDSRIVVTGRAEDDVQIGSVQIGIVNSGGQYMSTQGVFSAGERYVSAFLTSPGSPGSNYSYTSPILPAGIYTVRVRAADAHGQTMDVPRDSTGVTVSAPAGNLAPVARATVSCSANVCTFDGRTTTDENTPTVTYAWNYGNGRTGTGAAPVFTYTGPGTFTVTLTARDEYGLTSTTTLTVTITEPAGNLAPSAVITPPSCALLVCNVSGAQSADPNVGDTITYRWNFGDGTATSTLAAPSHTFPAAGSYTVTLTTADGWGRSATTTRTVTVSAT